MISDGGYLKMEYKVGIGVKISLKGVCKNCFAACYSCGHTYIGEICSSIKKGEVNVDAHFQIIQSHMS